MFPRHWRLLGFTKGRNNFPSFLFFFFYLKAMNSFASGQEENGVGNFFCSAPRYCMADRRRMRGKNGGPETGKNQFIAYSFGFFMFSPHFFFSSTRFFRQSICRPRDQRIPCPTPISAAPTFSSCQSPDRPFEDANHRSAGDELSPKN